MKLKNLGKDYPYIIFSYEKDYFIPGDRDTAFSEEFHHLSYEECTDVDFSLGKGWLFDQNGINEIRRMFEEQEVPYIESSLSQIRTYNP